MTKILKHSFYFSDGTVQELGATKSADGQQEFHRHIMSLQTSQPLVVNDNVSVTSDDTSSQDSMLSYIKKSGPSFKLNFDEDPTFWKLNDSKYRHFFLFLKV